MLQYLASAANELLTHLTVVGENRLVALNAVWFLLPQDVLLSIQGLLTLCTIIALSHHDPNESTVLKEDNGYSKKLVYFCSWSLI